LIYIGIGADGAASNLTNIHGYLMYACQTITNGTARSGVLTTQQPKQRTYIFGPLPEGQILNTTHSQKDEVILIDREAAGGK
jgi:hypothetical protein